MGITQKKMLQLLRGNVVDSKELAIQGIQNLVTSLPDGADGTPVVGRYKATVGENKEVRSIYGIFHQLDGASGVTFFENKAELDERLAELEAKTSVASDDNTIVITTATTGDARTDLSVNVDGLTIVKATEGDNKGKISTAVKIQYVAAVQASEGKEAVPAHISLMDNANTELSTVQVSDLIGNGVLDHSKYIKETGMLHLYFKQADGTLKDEQINLAEMLDIDDVVIGDKSQDYLKVTLGTEETSGFTLDTKIVDISAATETKTGLLDAYDVKQYVDAAAAKATTIVNHNGDNKNITVSSTTETDGHITYTVNETGLTPGDGSYISADATVAENLTALDTWAKTNALSGGSVNGSAITISHDATSGTSFSVVISGSDINVGTYETVEYPEAFSAKSSNVSGDITVAQAFNKVETTISALTQEVLDNEETTEKAIEALANAAGVLDNDEIVYVANTADTYINEATSLKDADDKLDAAIKSLSANTKTTVIGSSAITATSVTNEESGTVITVAVDAILGKSSMSKENTEGVAGLVLDGEGDTSKLDVSFDFGTFEN